MNTSKHSCMVAALLACATANATVIDYSAMANGTNVAAYDPNMAITITGGPAADHAPFAWNGYGIGNSFSAASAWGWPTNDNINFIFGGTVSSFSFDVDWQGNNAATGYEVTYSDSFVASFLNSVGGLISLTSDALHGDIAAVTVTNNCNGTNNESCYNQAGFDGNWNYNILSVSYDGFETVSSVPEPASIALISLSLLGLGAMRRKSVAR